jgi:large subunit ribosomal protein L9
MKVILKKDVKGSGKFGDVITVKDGYAQNYLIPNKLAVEANTKNLTLLKQHNQVVERQHQLEYEHALELQKSLSSVTLKAKSGAHGKLFGSITAKDVSEAIKEQNKLEIDKKWIKLEDSIKSLGVFDIGIRLHPEVKGEIQVRIIEEQV